MSIDLDSLEYKDDCVKAVSHFLDSLCEIFSQKYAERFKELGELLEPEKPMDNKKEQKD